MKNLSKQPIFSVKLLTYKAFVFIELEWEDSEVNITH